MSLSFTPSDDATPIAIAVPEGDRGSSSKRVLYFNPRREVAGGSAVTKYSATGHVLVDAPAGTRFEALPESEEKGRQVILVTGPSGSGKSHFMRSYATAYHKLFPDRSIFLISSLGEDDTLDALGPQTLHRIDLNKLVADFPEKVTPWANSLVMIDDVEGLDPVKASAVQRVQDLIASEGRHTNTTLVRSSHLATDYKRTRLLLQEVHGFVLYPQSGSHSGYTYLLEKYGGFDKKETRELLRTNARWIYVHHSFPKYLLTPFVCKLL